ncbi:ABC transporter ATP-binding protein [Niallia taxi]|uniref:ABC transporter ATP-binding protein n=1 Tax=Niallia taxi TaxID=2499688 RepID=UPI0015F52809|nr:ABC transporter ATP-binding protein [Niallia taxi]MDK8643369.1 ABC transporter ATP-binding protein [Niallia taxi]MED4039988.1 ABC transporter ATP-binding protein [Niallia taxi]MED4056346.1 ABC transporter ATP-binding protein [Niallia taxi]MED4121939.1 ABC transporter ATP-binding protein [Niallia taxi]
MIQFENVSKLFQDGTTAVNSINLTINKGELFVLIGPSGSGKTTTLKMINRLIDITNGTILIDGKKISEYDIHELRWNIGYVLQQIALFPHLTIAENIAVVPEMKKWTKEKIAARVDELLEMVGLEPQTYKNRKPNELSGGQQQRIGVIRALAADPEIILMDEPFSALDPISREKLQDDIVSLQKAIKKTIVFVTHDMQEALKLGDKICIMKDGEIVQTGTPEELINNPVNDFVKDFIGRVSYENISFKLEQILSPLTISHFAGTIIPATSSFQETLEALSENDQIGIEKDGAIIGLIDRQSLIQYQLNGMKEGGKE